MSGRFAFVGAGLLFSLVAASACGYSADSDSSSGTSSKQVTVVASTDVWGDVVKQVAGDLVGETVRISSIITDPDADPHTYEADNRNQLALSRAEVVVQNGGGYDGFVTKMLKAADNDRVTLLNAVEISGKTAPQGGELNEHVWYDFPTVQKVAARVVSALSAADPDDASTFQSNAKAFDVKLAAMEQTEASIKSAHRGEGAAITEPVPLYMLEACGLVNKTAPAFSEAIEEDTDVPASVLKQAVDLFDNQQVKVLAYNAQTSGPESKAVEDAAKANGIPVVPVTETLPSGKDYVTWMQANLSAIQKALG